MNTDVKKAKENLSELIDKAYAGEEVIIKKDDVLAVKLVPVPKPKKKYSRFGSMPGIKMKDNFDDPLPAEMAKAFGMADQK